VVWGFETGALGSMQNAARQRPVVAWHEGVAPWLEAGIALLLISLLGRSSTSAMLGYAGATTLVLVSQILFFRRRILHLTAADVPGPEHDPQRWRTRMTSYAWPFAAWGAFTWAQMASDRWALRAFGSTRDVAFYAVL